MYQTAALFKSSKGVEGWYRQSHRLVITRSRLTKPHDSAVSHEPPYMCAEATLIAFVICAAAGEHISYLPHPCSWGRPMSHQARGRLKGTLLERARAKERARATADVLYVEQDVAGQHNTCVPFTSGARSHRYHGMSAQRHNLYNSHIVIKS